ncbi:MAG: hypothetical protein RMJ66_06255 [Bacteroidia bacterium]|nr:hypothetical protein [Bacteroidia bacterium]MDW8134654.1 hypothetical protein [Bacteroidia bacterium]
MHVTLLLLGVALIGVSRASDEKASKMVLRMEKNQVEVAEKALSALKGIKSTHYDESKGELTVLYHKPTLGCCSQIHAALQKSGVKYTLVSNQEVPACIGEEKEHSDSHLCAGKKGGKCCTKHKKSSKGCKVS